TIQKRMIHFDNRTTKRQVVIRTYPIEAGHSSRGLSTSIRLQISQQHGVITKHFIFAISTTNNSIKHYDTGQAKHSGKGLFVCNSRTIPTTITNAVQNVWMTQKSIKHATTKIQSVGHETTT